MPTVILIDSSLSMLRPANKPSEPSSDTDGFQIMDLAKWGVDLLLGHIEKSYKLEHIAVLSYGCQCDLVCPFTRDMSEIRAKITTVDGSDSTNIISGLKGVINYVQESWGNSTSVNVIAVTDGGTGHGKRSLKSLLENRNLLEREISIPLGFSGTLNVVLVNHMDEANSVLPTFEHLIELAGLPGQVLVPQEQPGHQLTRASVEKCFQTLIDIHFKPFVGKLNLGDELSSNITLSPPPTKYKKVKEFETVHGRDRRRLGHQGLLDPNPAIFKSKL